jgi:hypothetical protein
MGAHSRDPEVYARREAELAAAKTAGEVDAMQQRWAAEDWAADQAADLRTREVVELRSRIAVLERVLGPGGRRLGGDLAKGFGDALRKIRQADRAAILGELEQRGFVTYGGVWDENSTYARGALVTHAGSAWVALTPAEKGLRPGKAPAWRLCIKSGDGKGPLTV